MPARPGLWARAVEAVRSLVLKETLVGRDAAGNAYYKWMAKDLSGAMVEHRRVRVPGNDLLYDPRTIPSHWRAWLAKTRADPPNQQEQEQAAERQRVMAARVAAINEREAQSRVRRQAGAEQQAGAAPNLQAFLGQMQQPSGRSQAAGPAATAGPQQRAGEPPAR